MNYETYYKKVNIKYPIIVERIYINSIHIAFGEKYSVIVWEEGGGGDTLGHVSVLPNLIYILYIFKNCNFRYFS